MTPVVKALITLIIGSVLGWWLLLGFCSIPGLKFGVACGHNAYIWVPLFIPLGIYVCWLTLGVISHRLRKKTETENGVGKNA